MTITAASVTWVAWELLFLAWDVLDRRWAARFERERTRP